MPRPKRDPKADALLKSRCMHPHPDMVTEEIFGAIDFFDPRDIVQVKYEMLRKVHTEGESVSRAAASFGLSRQSYYTAEAAYEAGGLSALLPKISEWGRPPNRTGKSAPLAVGIPPRRRGPPLKLTGEKIEALREALAEKPDSSLEDLAILVKERFGLSVHPRTIQTSLAREGIRLK